MTDQFDGAMAEDAAGMIVEAVAMQRDPGGLGPRVLTECAGDCGDRDVERVGAVVIGVTEEPGVVFLNELKRDCRILPTWEVWNFPL